MNKPPKTTIRQTAWHAFDAFTLVEIVLVVGLVAFVLIPAIGALAMAYRSSQEARNNMESAVVLQSASTVLSGIPQSQLRQHLDAQDLELFFAEGGRFLGTNATAATNTFYRVLVLRTPDLPATNALRQNVILTVAYPSPTYNQTIQTPVSIFGYGSRR